MKSREIAQRRLLNQQILATRSNTPAAVVRRLGALQAQDYLGALWSVGLRLAQASEGEIEQALAEAAIVRSWPMRGTLHFVCTEDLRWMLALLAPRILARSASRRRDLELDDLTLTHGRLLIEKALQGGRQLTRAEMFALLSSGGISPAGQRGIHILGHLAQSGLICHGPRRGKEQTFVLLEEWLPRTAPLERDEALALLARRFYTGHGPATLHDLVWWAGLTVTEARRALDLARSDLEQVSGENGGDLWMAADSPAAGTLAVQRAEDGSVDGTAGGHLLPGFDELLLGYKDRSAVLDPAHAQRLQPGGNGIFAPSIILHGKVAGCWRRTIKRQSVEVKLEPFAAFSSEDVLSLQPAAERYGRFLGLAVTLR